MTAVSGVGVHTTHRRQGVLSRMMGAMLADGVDRGESIAGLLWRQSRPSTASSGSAGPRRRS